MTARLLFALSALGLAASCDRTGGARRQADAAPRPQARPASQTASAPQRAASDPSYVGVITARDNADVPAKVEGELAAVYVRIGDRVADGDLIAAIVPRPLEQKLAIAKAALESARAAAAEAEVVVLEAREKLTIEEAAFAQGTTSRKQLVDARYETRRAAAARTRAAAEQRQQRARVAELERHLADTRIRAPFAGTVAVRYLDPGSLVHPGTPIVRLITGEALWVRFAVPGDQAPRLVPGGEVVVTVDSVGASTLATVRQIAPELEPSSQMILVEAEMTTSEALRARIQAGLEARVRLAAE